MDRPLCLIVNPAAGNGRSIRMLPQVTEVLTQAGADHRVTESASLEHARELAAQAVQRGDAVVAVGGDGLVGAVAGTTAAEASGVAREGTAAEASGAAREGTAAEASGAARGQPAAVFGIIPAGRGNDLARVLGVPVEPTAAARVLISGQPRPIDMIGVSAPGQAEQIVAGSVYAGIPSVAGQIANTMGWVPGWLVYNVAALRALARWQTVRFTVEIGQPAGGSAAGSGPLAFDGYAAIVANNPFFGAGMRVAPEALIDDGALDIVLMRDARKATFVRALLKVADGTHTALPQVDVYRGADVTITMSRDMPAAADGEPLPCATPLAAGTPLRIRALAAVLRVLVPAAGGAGSAI